VSEVLYFVLGHERCACNWKGCYCNHRVEHPGQICNDCLNDTHENAEPTATLTEGHPAEDE
jgi:hypothetical protein